MAIPEYAYTQELQGNYSNRPKQHTFIITGNPARLVAPFIWEQQCKSDILDPLMEKEPTYAA